MKLTIDNIKNILQGAVCIEEHPDHIAFSRFSKEQLGYYKETSPEHYYIRAQSAAGMKMQFMTDSRKLFIEADVDAGCERNYFSFDVFADGKMIGCLDNFSDVTLPVPYTESKLENGVFSKEFDLGDGMKMVTIYLPWSASVKLNEISLDDGAELIPAERPKKKLIAYGDSITQGYDALRPSSRYMSILSEKLGAEEFNKAIGGERFAPELAKIKDEFEPDYVIVAYGTNDWCVYDEPEFTENCIGFFENIHNNYPNSRIFAVSPIWRKEYKDDTAFGPFENVAKIISETVSKYDNITFICGFDLIPKEEKYFADFHLHPNNDGFKFHAENLYNLIKDKL